MSEGDFFFAIRNEDGSVTIDFPKEWPQGTKDNFEAAIDLFVQRGKELEQARIIKLLEERLKYLNEVKPITATAYGHWEATKFAIALIKGETE